MISAVAKWVIARRWLVVIAAFISTAIILFNTIPQMPLDVFPNFAPPQIEIETEAPGLAPEEIESLVTLPIESSINGTPGINSVRSSSSAGLSVVRVVFGWGTDIYQARQLIQERLQQAANKLPEGIETPRLAPISSPIGTVLKYAFTVENEGENQNLKSTIDLMEVRRIIDWQVTNRLLGVPGVSQVLVYGGDVRQYQVLVDPNKLRAFNVSLQQVSEAVQGANVNAPGGFLITPDKQTLIRGIGRIESLNDLKQSVIVARQGTPVRLGDVADIQIGSAIKIGDGSLNGKDAVVVMVNKQPLADTPTVTHAIETAMTELQAGLPKGVKVTQTFRQADYIDASVENVRSALMEGSIIAAIILIPFLMNWRTLGVVLLNFALTFIFSLQVLSFLGLGLNTMTLGGLAVAIGTAIDDAIVYAENIVRLLRQNKSSSKPRPVLEIVFAGVQEVQESLIGATLITIVVFSPVFALAGVEGRIFGPMGITYLVVVMVSSLESLLISPALCAILLPQEKMPLKEPLIPRIFKQLYYPCLDFAIHSPVMIISVAVAGMVAAIVIFPALGRAFLPEFQETTLVNTLALYPGSSLEATNSAAFVLETKLKDDSRLKYVQLRAGRAPNDPDAAPVNLAHLDIGLSDQGMEKRQETVEWLREEFNQVPGAAANIGGFISHRIDEILSGIRSQIAVKIFGSDLEELRRIGKQVEGVMSSVSGLVDLQLEPQVPIEQMQIKFDRVAASRYGLTVGQLSEIIETALNGKVVSQVLEQQQSFDLVVWLQPQYRNNLQTIENLLVDIPSAGGDAEANKIPLAKVAKVTYATGPNTINRENVSRLIVVSANAQGRDLRSLVNEIQNKVKAQVQLPSGYFIQYGGQFEAEERASQNILIFSGISFVVITVLMYLSVKSLASTAMIMINLPIALVGGVIAVALTGGVVSVASLVGFVTLFGVATRNGLLLVDNYITKFGIGMSLKEILIAGSMERLNAILMTSFTSALGLVPLVIAVGPGKEVLQPLSIVVLGGLFTSTALTLIVLPALYSKFGKFLLPQKNPAFVEDGKVTNSVLEN
ncbi:MAG: efflux RND transporter permease subunit [Nostoc sp. DedQUE05]|uniref:efflux RND transporter permease subunit n=1 Tax=Nostoc sp. DedQUE05 TaxID=3075391 RepID=UPI002AD34285|nr:efflux RND transporter permease subunit [Nostoc sp. DedQUE05]MDZ8090953.1 efflux RND transporter permease subunit [Nostoc sp. DedQUE05]